jgi:hypothetical protein
LSQAANIARTFNQNAKTFDSLEKRRLASEQKIAQLSRQRTTGATEEGRERNRILNEQIERERENLAQLAEERQALNEQTATAAAGAVATAFGGPVIGGAIQSLIDILFNPEIFTTFVEAFVDALPDLLTRLLLNSPKLIRFFAIDLPIALAEAFAEAVRTLPPTLADELQKAVRKAFEDIEVPKIGSPGDVLGGIEGFFKDLGGGGSASISVPSFGLATGGQVTGTGTKDTVPAILTPGEVVIDRTTGPRLMEFIDTFNKQGPQQGQDMSGVESLLVQLLEQKSAPQAPINVQLTMDGSVLEEKILELNNNNSRLS